MSANWKFAYVSKARIESNNNPFFIAEHSALFSRRLLQEGLIL